MSAEPAGLPKPACCRDWHPCFPALCFLESRPSALQTQGRHTNCLILLVEASLVASASSTPSCTPCTVWNLNDLDSGPTLCG